MENALDYITDIVEDSLKRITVSLTVEDEYRFADLEAKDSLQRRFGFTDEDDLALQIEEETKMMFSMIASLKYLES